MFWLPANSNRSRQNVLHGRKRFQLWTREAVPYEIFDESKGVQKEIIDRANGVRFRSYKESRGTIIVSFFFFFRRSRGFLFGLWSIFQCLRIDRVDWISEWIIRLFRWSRLRRDFFSFLIVRIVSIRLAHNFLKLLLIYRIGYTNYKEI